MAPNNKENFSLKDLLSKIDDVHSLVKLIPAVIGTVILVVENFEKNSIAFYIGLALICLTALWFIIKKVIKARTARDPNINLDTPEKPSAYIRGLLPFEQRDKLLGRDEERKQINTIINSSDFTFGYISGEAGSGKTSFIRSIVIDEVLKSDMFPLSIKTVTGNPIKAINQTLLKEIEGTLINEAFTENMNLLSDKLKKTIVILIDQFEEFFVGIKSANERKEVIKELTALLDDKRFNVKILISIRKEFVDDLQEFSPEIDQPTNRRFSLRLRNWDVPLAKSILTSIVDIDKLRFSDQLCFELISDLARDGYVRPVEFQIVAKSLLDSKIYDFNNYLSKGRANGILAAYIKEIIQPQDIATSELERQITRTILRILCDDKNDTKRAIGLTWIELQNLVKSTIISSDQKNLIVNNEDFEKYLAISLGKLLNQYVIKYEDDQKINLLHDYIVSAIRIATSDIETTEEQANRLLNKYLEDQKTISNITIPRKHYKFIKQNASHDLKQANNSVRILKRTALTIQLYNIAPVFLVLILVTAIFPPRVKEVKASIFGSTNIEWTYDDNGKILVAQTKDSTYIWHNGTELKLLKRLAKSIITKVSRDGQWLMVTDSIKTYLFQNVSDTSFHQRIVINEFPGNYYRSSNYGFDDKSHFYILTSKGNLYLLNLTKENSNPQPFIKAFIDTSKSLYDNPHLFISPNGKYLCCFKLVESSKHRVNNFFVIPLSESRPTSSRLILGDVKSDFFTRNQNLTFNSTDSLIAYAEGPKVYIIKVDKDKTVNLQNEKPIIIDTSNSRRSKELVLSFSPDERWIFARATFGLNYAISSKDTISFPLENSDESSSERGEIKFNFSSDGKYCSFNDRRRNLYLIKINNISHNNLPFKPVINNADENFSAQTLSRLKYNSSNRLVIANNVSGYIYSWKVDSVPDLKKPIVYYDNNNPIMMYWSNIEDFAYTFSNNRMHFGNVSQELKTLNVKIESEIKDMFTSADQSKLVVISKNEMFTVERKFFLWDILPVKSYSWNGIIRK